MQPFDLTTVVAVCADLRASCVPAKLERVHQRDRTHLFLSLRTAQQRLWLLISWHPQAARMHLSPPPPSIPDTFTFSQQIWHQVSGLALTGITQLDPWERVVHLEFAPRPGVPPQWHLYVELMGKYSNVLLVNREGLIVTAAHQVSDRQSRVRPIQTGESYVPPPPLVGAIPHRDEPLDRWRDRLTVLPQALGTSLRQTYRGVSTSLAQDLVGRAAIPPWRTTTETDEPEWRALYTQWQRWLGILAEERFGFILTEQGYSVLADPEHALPLHGALDTYYGDRWQQQHFQQRQQQLHQVLQHQIKKQTVKIADLKQRLVQSQGADRYRSQADLLMAHLSAWRGGMTELYLPDFATGVPVAIALDPTQNGVQNAQRLYRKSQKLRRAVTAIRPLLEEAEAERDYLEQVLTALQLLEPDALDSLAEIRQELHQQGYLAAAEPGDRRRDKKSREPALNCHRFPSPSGFEIWVGRNNYQNDLLTHRYATDYDLWFHAQEIPGSHVLLRLSAGAEVLPADLAAAAELAAYFSRARHSDSVPVVYTRPQYVRRPKAAKPGMVLYSHEALLWARPQLPPQGA
jgi:predicted ribosome quality control (RQC) complex YloA/Tae2 family protein